MWFMTTITSCILWSFLPQLCNGNIIKCNPNKEDDSGKNIASEQYSPLLLVFGKLCSDRRKAWERSLSAAANFNTTSLRSSTWNPKIHHALMSTNGFFQWPLVISGLTNWPTMLVYASLDTESLVMPFET